MERKMTAFQILFNSVFLSAFIYLILLITLDVLYFSLPTSFILCIIIAILNIYFKLDKPDKSLVDEILGHDLFQEAGDANKSNYKMKMVAHRGAGFDAPENSIVAIQKAHEKGCTAVEIDLALTADGVPIVFHDTIIDRVTDKTGSINEMTWEQLKQLDISKKHPFREKYCGEKIATFENLINECIKLDLRIFIDVKADNSKGMEIILNTFKENPILYKRAIVSCFNYYFIYKLRKADPTIICSLIWRPYFISHEHYNLITGQARPRYQNIFQHLSCCILNYAYDWAFFNLAPLMTGTSAVLVHKDTIDPHSINYWRNLGIRVIAWSVNIPLEKMYFHRILKIPYLSDTMDGENWQQE